MIALALAAIFVSGAGLSGSLPKGALRRAVGLAFGLGAWSAAYAAALLLAGPKALVAKDVALVALGVALMAAVRPRSLPLADEPAPRWLAAFFAAACALAAAAFVEHTIRLPDGGWDAWMVWNLRARFLARDAANFRAAFSPDLLFLAHQDYPWLVPGLVAQGFLLAGREPPLVPAGIAFIFGALCVAVVALGLARLRGRRAGILGGIAVATLPCFPTFASNQQSDVPLAVFFAIAVVLVALAIERDSLRLFVPAGFAAGLCAWTKNEGAMYAVFLGLALLAHRRSFRAVWLYALGALPCAALFIAFKLSLAPPNDLAVFSTRADVLARALDVRRIGLLFLLVLRRIVYFQDFALWIVAELLALWLYVRRLPSAPATQTVGTAIVLCCLAYAPIYILQPHRLDWIFRTSADRLFMQLWPAMVLSTLLSLTKSQAQTRAHT